MSKSKKTPKVEEIFWNEDQALLIHGETSIEEAEELAHQWIGAGQFKVGRIERFRKYPAQWHDFTVERVSEGQSIRGSFKARLVQ